MTDANTEPIRRGRPARTDKPKRVLAYLAEDTRAILSAIAKAKGTSVGGAIDLLAKLPTAQKWAGRTRGT